ncbi:adenosylhomocysteine nucleosidase [Arcanobacterium wilhelmae]|uniref:Adenosylhomocysteine nucleosidase n=1 Tax=Arcanobacterium wilhelmae TaxID=1803177 RepID=A0ABT9NCQ2_9ACTO|nr:5'-methylthioadenosine/S-adenosylhomocysteine nucleosidase [Arcanobacterium wilhelmae]MDP9800976.1 adenosylhomocysteine nucleosidase [Arcanobacterium wilhelmae]WFN90336.1 5'-methylthioadenosine/S-adenosylhomocysteine nucleosidase [Arcanobacterium wilhelmae]
MIPVNALIISAMPQEMAPMHELLAGAKRTEVENSVAKVVAFHRGRSDIVTMVTGIGMAACASALGWALAKYQPRAIVSIGSTGGLAADSRVGQVVVGATYINGGADGTAFGYAPGQVPGQPPVFDGDPDLLDGAQALVNELATSGGRVHWSEAVSSFTSSQAAGLAHEVTAGSVRIGQMLSSDAFVTERNVEDKREVFPAALSADMESHAAAQTAARFGVPFVSVRGISDLCGKPDDQSVSFHAELSDVATSAAIVAMEVLYRGGVLETARSSHGPAKHFGQRSLMAAMYLMLASANDLEPMEASEISQAVREEISAHLEGMSEAEISRALGLIAAGDALTREDPQATLTAKEYDQRRAQFIAMQPDAENGFLWPPTSQTIIKRFNGYWNDALAAIGLEPRRGRARGGLKFSQDDYIYAIRAYMIDAAHTGASASFAGYKTWLERKEKKGELPSGAAIRQRFGSWKAALSAAMRG